MALEEFNTKDRLLSWISVFILASAITAISSIPGENTPQIDAFPHQDKVFHFLVFGVFSLFLVRALDRSFNWRNLWLLSVSVLVVFVLGILDEYHQLHVSGRSAEVADVMADTLGALVFVSGWLGFNGRGRRCEE